MRGGASVAVDVELHLDAAQIRRVEANLVFLSPSSARATIAIGTAASGTTSAVTVACWGAAAAPGAACIVERMPVQLGAIAAPGRAPLPGAAPTLAPSKPPSTSVPLSEVPSSAVCAGAANRAAIRAGSAI